MRRLLVSLAVLATPHAAVAEAIATDRPDFVESSATVGEGVWQVETSVAWENDREASRKDTAWSTPTLLRYGLSANWEARLETDGWIDARSRLPGAATRDSEGFADLSVGLKRQVAGGPASGPSMAWLFHVDLASGDRAFRGTGARPSVRLVAEWELTPDIGVGVMPGVVYENAEQGRYVAALFGAVIGKGWTDRFRSFVEVSLPHIARSEDGGTEASLTLGSAYLISADVQWDVAVSFGLNDRTADRAVTSGLSVRW